MECLTAQQLEELARGALGDDAAAALQVHVITCAACQRRYARARDEEGLARELRGLSTDVPLDRTRSRGDAPPSNPADAVPSGVTIPGYEILRELHRGGQGIVYQAMQQSTKRKVAVKLLLEGQCTSQAARRRFEREIELVAQLKHPRVISIFDSGQTADGRQFAVMDYVRGVTLTKYVHERKLTLESALELFGKVCDAVQYAHQKGVIHRDLKPSNILVDSDGEPRVLDFGLAKPVIDPSATVLTLTEQVVGTLPYMSPEQIRGNPEEIDTRTDVYALGVILYEMLTGHYPYPVIGQLADVLRHIAETEPTPPSRSWKSDSGITQRSTGRKLRVGECPIDDEVQTIVLKLLSKERERRYQSAGELQADIRRYRSGEPIEAKRDSGWYVFRKSLRRYRLHAGALVFIIALVVVCIWGIRQQQAARHATRIAQRRQWVAALNEARLRQDYAVPATERACQQIWQLVATNDATSEEKQTLLSNVLEPFFLPRRTLLSLAQLGADHGVFFGLNARGFPVEYVLVCNASLKLDGVALRRATEIYLGVHPGGPLSRQTPYALEVDLPHLDVGQHTLSGVLHVRFARIRDMDHYAEQIFIPEDACELLDVSPVDLPIGPHAMTVVAAYPADYPLMLTDEQYAARFAREFHVDRLSVSADRSTQLSPDEEFRVDTLDFEVSFPAPPLEIACDLRLVIPGLNVDELLLLAAGPGGDGHLSGRSSFDGSGTEFSNNRISLRKSLSLTALLGARRPHVLADTEAVIEITPSRSAALTLNMDIERFLAVSGTSSAVVRDLRAADRVAAEDLAYSLLEELVLPSLAVEKLRAEIGKNRQFRDEAIQILRLRGRASALNELSWTVARAPRMDPGEYERARRLAEAACELEPQNGAFLNTLGVALYRSGRYADALDALRRAERMISDRRGDGHLVGVAFIAMSMCHLGRAEEARAEVDRLIQLMQSESQGGRDRLKGLLAEVEALLPRTPDQTPHGETP